MSTPLTPSLSTSLYRVCRFYPVVVGFWSQKDSVEEGRSRSRTLFVYCTDVGGRDPW